MGMSSQQKSQWYGERQYPLAHRHSRDDVIDQVSGGLCHAPCTTGGAKTTPLTGEGHELFMGAVGAANAQDTMGQDAAL